MSEPWNGRGNGRARERALWRRWAMVSSDPGRGTAGEDGARDALTPDAPAPDAMAPETPAPDAMTLAAFAEDRLDAAARAAVETFLAANPAIAADVAAARHGAMPVIDEAALAATIARASSLVSPSAGAAVLPFRPVRRPASPWPGAVRWSAVAASLVLVSWLGFALGSASYGSLAGEGAAGGALVDELFDPPGGFFGFADTSGT
jgi:anti-sigma factor RsiW